MTPNPPNPNAPPTPLRPIPAPRRGVQYVIGTPPQMPVLRPLREHVYDREPVWGPMKESLFFVDNRDTSDGRKKDVSFTNMWQCGQLGFPLEFDLTFLSIRPVRSDLPYVEQYERFVWSSSVFSWFFGCQTKVLEMPVTGMSIRGPLDQRLRDPVTGKLYRLTVQNGVVVPVETESDGVPTPPESGLLHRLITRYVNMTVPDRKARRITSTESFKGEIKNYDRGEQGTGKDIDVYVCMEGIFYKQI